MKTVPLYQLFDIKYGNQFDLNKMEIVSEGDANSIFFVSRTSQNLGVSAFVKEVDGVESYPAGSITVSLGGTYLLSSFVQQRSFYTGQNIKILTPKREMSEKEKIYYCMTIEANRYRYTTHGREANQTLDYILVPEVPHLDIEKIDIPIPAENSLSSIKMNLDTSTRKSFRYEEIFDIQKGYYNKKPEMIEGGEIPFVGATEYNNGITGYCAVQDIENTQRSDLGSIDGLDKKIFPAGAITVSNNGSVGYAFYQSRDFTCSHDVNPLYIKDTWNKKMNVHLAMFLITLIEQEQYRWAYGRKRRPSRMPDSVIKLPITSSGSPDRERMENYIKSLPYSASL